MHTIVMFETDEAADDFATRIGIPVGEIDDHDEFTIIIDGDTFTLALQDNGWVLTSDTPFPRAVLTLIAAFPRDAIIGDLCVSYSLLKGLDTQHVG